MTNAKDWKLLQSEMADMEVDSINALRNVRDLTIKELAERLATYGWTVSVPTLTGILSGRKRDAFTVAETMAFARALNVSPMYLILGLPRHSEFPAGPLLGEEHDVGTVAAWFAGNHVMTAHPDDDILRVPKTPEGARRGLVLLQDHAFDIHEVRREAALIIAAGEFPPREISRVLSAEAVADRVSFRQAVNALLRTRDTLRRLGEWAIPLPPLPGWLQSIDGVPPMETLQPTTDELRTLTTEPLIEEARTALREELAKAPQQRPSRRDADNTR